MDEGSCGRYTMRWYFNIHVQACRPFIYSGCEGNDNRFLHLEDCEEACLRKNQGTHTPRHALALHLCRLMMGFVVQVLNLSEEHDD